MNPIDTAAFLLHARARFHHLDDYYILRVRRYVERRYGLSADGALRLVSSALREHRGKVYNGQTDYRHRWSTATCEAS